MSSEFPFVGSVAAKNATALGTFKEWAWDFQKDCFKRDGDGRMILLEGREALQVWIYKTMKTRRYRYLAYSWRYGTEIYDLIGKVLSNGERRSEFRRGIIEALLVNPWIKAVTSVEFVEAGHGRVLEVNVTVDTVYGELTI